jgi:hypothetical protein
MGCTSASSLVAFPLEEEVGVVVVVLRKFLRVGLRNSVADSDTFYKSYSLSSSAAF